MESHWIAGVNAEWESVCWGGIRRRRKWRDKRQVRSRSLWPVHLGEAEPRLDCVCERRRKDVIGSDWWDASKAVKLEFKYEGRTNLHCIWKEMQGGGYVRTMGEILPFFLMKIPAV